MISRILFIAQILHIALAQDGSEKQCSAEFVPEPRLQEMDVDFGNEQDKFMAYVLPNITAFYDAKPPASTPVPMKFKGFAGKFQNLSNKRLELFWEAGPDEPGYLIAGIRPFHAVGTATFPDHVFYLTPAGKPDEVLIRFEMEPPRSNYYYDPYYIPGDEDASNKLVDSLPPNERELYLRMYKNRLFNEQYFEKTGREYISMYPRKKPSHKMWPADFFGQEHWIMSKETHFSQQPPENELEKITTYGKARVIPDDAPRLLSKYRTGDPMLNITLKVLSCAPRVFEIKNFLSDVELRHIHKLAAGFDLSLSLTGGFDDGDEDGSTDNRRTRTSFNTWVPRETTPVVDAIYRRAADVLRIDEALLRYRGDGEHPDLGTEKSIAESLQLVHYDVTQEYTAHHDFGYARLQNNFQPARFATLLLYLNDGMEGGETTFPRWVNAETFHELAVTPEAGKAVLFYSQLPDGNMDDLSQHAALPVTKGEKWLMNLWVWDPIYETMSGQYDDED